jgi:hypothetical protein
MKDYFKDKIESTKVDATKSKANEEMKKRLNKMIAVSKTSDSLKGKLKDVVKLNDSEVTKLYKTKLKELTKKK